MILDRLNSSFFCMYHHSMLYCKIYTSLSSHLIIPLNEPLFLDDSYIQFSKTLQRVLRVLHCKSVAVALCYGIEGLQPLEKVYKKQYMIILMSQVCTSHVAPLSEYFVSRDHAIVALLVRFLIRTEVTCEWVFIKMSPWNNRQRVSPCKYGSCPSASDIQLCILSTGALIDWNTFYQ